MELTTVVIVAQNIISYTTTPVSISAQKVSMLTNPPELVNHVTTHVLVVLNLPNNVVVVKKDISYMDNLVLTHVQKNTTLMLNLDLVKPVTNLVLLVTLVPPLNSENVPLVKMMMDVIMDNTVLHLLDYVSLKVLFVVITIMLSYLVLPNVLLALMVLI